MHWQQKGHAVSLHQQMLLLLLLPILVLGSLLISVARTDQLSMAQDDAHIFCLPSQLTAEIRGALELVQKTMGAFGFTQLEARSRAPPSHAAGACMLICTKVQLRRWWS